MTRFASLTFFQVLEVFPRSQRTHPPPPFLYEIQLYGIKSMIPESHDTIYCHMFQSCNAHTNNSVFRPISIDFSIDIGLKPEFHRPHWKLWSPHWELWSPHWELWSPHRELWSIALTLKYLDIGICHM